MASVVRQPAGNSAIYPTLYTASLQNMKIINITKNSPADKAGIKAGDILVEINGEKITDVLDYMFCATEKKLVIKLSNRDVHVKKAEYEDLGLEFDSFLMDEQKHCNNKCVFCFIDQLPPKTGAYAAPMRETLYFKDDDSRLSFLQGNYISLTNLTEYEVERIIKMKLSVNVSVHTTNPELRIKMLGNPRAGEALNHLYKIVQKPEPCSALAAPPVEMNCQIVLCPGMNDGAELKRTLADLTKYESVKSIACVPVGLTKYREGLTDIIPFDKNRAKETLCIIEEANIKGNIYASDELYLLAGHKFPTYEQYGGFPQYENGVGMLSLLEHEFSQAAGMPYMATDNTNCVAAGRTLAKSIATGTLAAPFIEKLVQKAGVGANVQVHAIKNDFFGHGITVAGLVTGRDLINQLRSFYGKLGEELLIPETMLRAGEDVFLDDITVSDVQEALDIKVRVVEVDGAELYDALFD